MNDLWIALAITSLFLVIIAVGVGYVVGFRDAS